MRNALRRHHPAGSYNKADVARRKDYVGIRVGEELRTRAIYAAEQAGMTLSDWIRWVMLTAIEDPTFGVAPGDPEQAGYARGRQLGYAIAMQQAHDLIAGLANEPGMTLEEVDARFPNGIADLTFPRLASDH